MEKIVLEIQKIRNSLKWQLLVKNNYLFERTEHRRFVVWFDAIPSGEHSSVRTCPPCSVVLRTTGTAGARSPRGRWWRRDSTGRSKRSEARRRDCPAVLARTRPDAAQHASWYISVYWPLATNGWIKKVKVDHTRLPSVGFRGADPVPGSRPAGDVSHKPGARLPLLSARPAVTFP